MKGDPSKARDLIDGELERSSTDSRSTDRSYWRLSELLANPDALLPPPAVVPRFAWRERVTLLAAREKSGKSTLMRCAVAAVTTGSEFLGEQTIQGDVLIVTEEHPNDCAREVAAFRPEADQVWLQRCRSDNRLVEVHQVAMELRPTLLVADTLASLVVGLSPDSGKSNQWTEIMDYLRLIAEESGAALWILHHGTKATGEYRDSTAIGAGVDVILTMKEPKGHSPRRNFDVKGRYAMDPFSVTYLEADRIFELVKGDAKAKERRAAIMAFVREHPGCSQRDVEKGVEGRAGDIRTDLTQLIKDGQTEDRGSSAGKAFHVVEPGAAGG